MTPVRSFNTLALLAIASLLCLQTCAVRGQGVLTPSAAPAPTMKSLDQVEARIIVNPTNCPPSGAYTYYISNTTYPNGGSFYLTGNLAIASGSGGIYIAASNVTLDLNGFSIVNTGGNSLFDAIYVFGSNVTIRDGTIRGGGFAVAVAGGNGAYNTLVKNISANGMTTAGLSLTNGVVQGCSVNSITGVGISAPVVSDSSATQCSSTAISAQTTSNVYGTTTGGGAAVAPTADSQNISALVAARDTRTAIPASVSTVSITQPGSYYLSGNVVVASGDGITITSNDVDLDLNGFKVASTNGSGNGHGIYCSGYSNLAVFNGNISSPTTYGGTFTSKGFVDGISVTYISGLRIHDVSVTGVAGAGIDGSFSHAITISKCVVSTAVGNGISCSNTNENTISDCSANNCGGDGIMGNTIQGCTGSSVGSPYGDGINGSSVTNSSGVGNAGRGVNGLTVSNCYASSSSGVGINGLVVANSYGICYGSADGIDATVISNSTGATYGTSSPSAGIGAGTANGCYGAGSGGSSIALRSTIAIGCFTYNGSVNVPNKYLMP